MSGARRFFVERAEEETLLEGEEFEHAKNVLRLGVGEEVILLDNSGKEYSAVIAEVGKRAMKLHILRVNEGDREAATEVALLFGYLKNADKNEFIVQKAVELGVRKLVAFSSEYSSSYMNANKLERLNKVSREAAKQCLRSVAPAVEYCASLEEALRTVSGYKNKLRFHIPREKAVLSGRPDPTPGSVPRFFCRTELRRWKPTEPGRFSLRLQRKSRRFPSQTQRRSWFQGRSARKSAPGSGRLFHVLL